MHPVRNFVYISGSEQAVITLDTHIWLLALYLLHTALCSRFSLGQSPQGWPTTDRQPPVMGISPSQPVPASTPQVLQLHRTAHRGSHRANRRFMQRDYTQANMNTLLRALKTIVDQTPGAQQCLVLRPGAVIMATSGGEFISFRE